MPESEGFRDRLIKLLNLTTSPEDHEALSAARFANALVKKSGLTWETLLEEDRPIEYRSKPPPKHPEPTKVHVVDENDIHSIIDFIRENAWAQFDFSFLDSLEANFDDYRRLTWKQHYALKKVYEAVRQHAERR